MKIFIEHYPTQNEFAETLRKRLNSIKGITITTYGDLKELNHQIENEDVVEKLEEYDIIIPFVDEDYTNDVIAEKLEEYSDSNDKIILPLIYEETQWSSVNWIVKSKVFPESGFPFTALDEKSKADTINKLIKTIEVIVSQKNNPEKIAVNPGKIVFISHSHEDADFAELLKLQLEKNNIYGWVDSEKLIIGQDWRQEIDDGISNSVALIVIMTPEAKKSEYVTYEWAYAWGKQIPIFPIMLKQTPLHPRLESLQYLDFTNRSTRPWQKLLESLKLLQK